MLYTKSVKRIARAWQGGPLHALATTGEITPDCARDITEVLGYEPLEFRRNRRDLIALRAYVEAKGPRGPVKNWHKF